MKQCSRTLVAVAALMLPGITFANAGIPMLAVAWPLHWLVLAPIIVLEAFIVANTLGRPYRELVWPVAKANLISTLVGVPIAWAAMFVLQALVSYGVIVLSPSAFSAPTTGLLLFPFTVAWLGDVDTWTVYAAFVVLAIPFCVASVVVERWRLSISMPSSEPKALRSGVRTANIVSYVLMTIAALAFPLRA